MTIDPSRPSAPRVLSRREFTKKVHPELTTDIEDKSVLQEFFKYINQAFDLTEKGINTWSYENDGVVFCYINEEGDLVPSQENQNNIKLRVGKPSEFLANASKYIESGGKFQLRKSKTEQKTKNADTTSRKPSVHPRARATPTVEEILRRRQERSEIQRKLFEIMKIIEDFFDVLRDFKIDFDTQVFTNEDEVIIRKEVINFYKNLSQAVKKDWVGSQIRIVTDDSGDYIIKFIPKVKSFSWTEKLYSVYYDKKLDQPKEKHVRVRSHLNKERDKLYEVVKEKIDKIDVLFQTISGQFNFELRIDPQIDKINLSIVKLRIVNFINQHLSNKNKRSKRKAELTGAHISIEKNGSNIFVKIFKRGIFSISFTV